MASLGQRQKKQTRTEVERALKLADKRKLEALRVSIRAAKAARKGSVASVRATCRAERERITQRAREARDELRESIKRVREQAKSLCGVSVTDAREATGRAIAEAVEKLEHERGYQAQLRAWIRPSSCAVTPKARKGERRSESDCEVAANLEDASLRAVWERVKGKIKGSDRQTRTEAFLDWVHENSSTVIELQNEQEDRAIAALVKAEEKMRRELDRPDRYKSQTRAELDQLLDAVPF